MENTSTNTKPISKLKIGGEVKHVDQQFLQDNLDRFSQKYGNETVYVTNPDGQKGYIPISQLRTALDEGYTLFDDAANIQVPTPQNQESPKPQEQSKPQEPHIPTPGEAAVARTIGANTRNQIGHTFGTLNQEVRNTMQEVEEATANLPQVPRLPEQTDLEYAEAVAAASDKVMEQELEKQQKQMQDLALPTTRAEIDKQLDEINGELATLGQQRYGKLDANPAYGNTNLMGIDMNAHRRAKLYAENKERIDELERQRAALEAQKSMLRSIEKYQEYDRKGDKSGISNFFRAIKVGGDLQSLASFGLTKMQEDLNFAQILERAHKGETLTLDEKKAIQMYNNMREIAAMDRGAHFNAGLGMQQTFEFMRDIFLAGMTGGASAGNLIAQYGVKGAVKQFGKNTAKKAAEVYLKTALTPSFYKNLTSEIVDNYDLKYYGGDTYGADKKRDGLSLLYRTWAETGAEYFTESLSGLIGNIGIAKRIAQTARGKGMLSKALRTFDEIHDRTKQNPIGGKILEGLSKIGVGNIPEELLEEMAVVPLQSLTLGENRMGQLLDPRFYQEVLISTAAIGGMNSATNILVGGTTAAIEKRKTNNKIKDITASLTESLKGSNEAVQSAYDRFISNLENENFYDEEGTFAPGSILDDLQALRDATDNDDAVMSQAEELAKYHIFKQGQTEALRAIAEEELGPIEYGNSGSVLLFNDKTDGRTYHVLGETNDVVILGTNDTTIAPNGKIVVPKNTLNGELSDPVSISEYVADYFISKPAPTKVETLDDISEIRQQGTTTSEPVISPVEPAPSADGVQHFGGVATSSNGNAINVGDTAAYGESVVKVVDIYEGDDKKLEAAIEDENGEQHIVSFNDLAPVVHQDNSTKTRYILPDGRRAVVQSSNGDDVTLGILDDNNQVIEEIPSTMEEVLTLDKVQSEEAEVIETAAAEMAAGGTETAPSGTETAQIGTETAPSGTETAQIETDDLPRDKEGNIDYDALLTQSPTRFVEQMRSDFGAEVADVQLGKMVGNIDNKITELSEKVDKETSPNKVASMLREIQILQGQRDAISTALAPAQQPVTTQESVPAAPAQAPEQIAPDATSAPNEETSAPNEETSAPNEETSAPNEETSAPVEEIKPVGEGPFGKIYNQFKGKAREAIAFLRSIKEGEAIGALHHKDIGEISLVYGNDQAGLKKIAIKHPEVLDKLQELLDETTIKQQSENRIKLESDKYYAVVSKDYLGESRAPWLLTAFEKKNSVPNNRMDTDETSSGSKENDTATLQDTVSDDKDTTISETSSGVEKKNLTKPNDNQTETKPKPNKTILEKAQDTVETAEIDAAAQEANTEPTEAQKEAGNYKKGHTIIQGLNISIEQPKGSIRSGKDPNGKKWSVKMNNHYGYIRGTQGKDKDHIDVFIGDSPTSKKVYVVDQVGRDGSFDEHKVMIGFDSLEEARAAYLSNYEEGWQGLGNITETSMNEFKEWIGDGTPKTRQFAEYAKGIPESYNERAAQWQKKLGIGITVYNSIDDIKDKSVQEQLRAGIGVSGWISRDDNGALKEIGIYLPYINSKADVDKTAIHEIVAHYGLKGLLGEDKYNELCDNVWVLMRPYEQDQYLHYPGVNNDSRKAADEYIAHLAETLDPDTLSRSDKSIWEKIVEAVKNFFAPHKKTDVDLTDAISKADLSTLLRASYARLASESGKKTQSKKPSKFKLEDAVLKEKNSTRPALTGIYHDSGYKVASDTNVLVALKEDYPKSAEGKVFVKGKPITQSNYPKWQILFNDKFEKSNIPVDFDKLIEKLSTIKKNEGKMPYYISLKANDGQVYYYHPDRLMIFAKAAKEIGGELMMQRFNQGLSRESVKLIITSPRGKAIIMPVGKIGDSANIYDISFVDESTPVAQFVEKYETKENQTETKPKPKKTKEKPTTSKEVSSTPSKGKVQDQKIEDFGEKIGGARKDVARQRVRDAVNLTKTDLQKLADPDKILSRANIIKSLREGTMTKEDAITLMAMNNTVRCADSTEKYIMMPKYRDMALAWANGQSPIFHITDKDIEDRFEQIGEHIKARMSDAQVEKHKQNIKKYYDILYEYYSDYIKTYRDLDYPNVERKLGGAIIRKFSHSDSFWVLKKADARRGRTFRTMEAAIAYMEREYPVVVAKAKEDKTSADDSQKVGHLRVVKDSTGWFRIKSSEIPGEIYFSKSFSSRTGAEEYLQENRAVLIAKEQRAIDALMGSNIGMAERQGPDYRNGKDVTSDEYLKAFGFRGVEFGNWVTQAERQMYLNKSYDAIMDICSILGISPKAFSLGGKLAIAFGARGHSKAMAHYESSKQVINLTRMKGVGSFAHEWFHAIDNYLARENSGNTTEFVTEKNPTKRQELYDAFNEFVSKMNTLDYTRRSRRAGDYWGSVIERAARMFESYIYTELGAKDISSPLLVDSHSVLSDEYLLDSDISSYPIPTAEETRQIKPYLDKIFATIQEEVDADDNHILFRVAENIESFEEAIKTAKDKGYENLSAYPDVTNQMLEDALTSGRIMVYSKDPIAGGTTVSPSVQRASELSGPDAQIYSKDISIDQVAWETPDEGTYTTNDDIRFRFIGEQGAANLDRAEEASIRMDNLAVAREMEATGKDAKIIKMATGWERGADKKWRYEVEDNIDFDSPVDRLEILKEEYASVVRDKDKIIRLLNMYPTKGRTEQQKEQIKQLDKKHKSLIAKTDALTDSINEAERELSGMSLEELIGEDDNLFKEYPQLADIDVSFIRNSRFGNYKGFYSPSENTIWISPDNGQPASTLVHELQHAIQHIEGFARGGNTSTGNELRDKAKAWSWKKQLEQTEKEHPEFAGSIRLQATLEDEYKADGMEDKMPSKEIRTTGFNLYVRGYDNEGYESAYDQWEKIGLIDNPKDYSTYKRLAGEVEARNVQARKWMPASVRRESLAVDTEYNDVAREDQIFIMDGIAAQNDVRFRAEGLESLVERTYRKDGSFSFSGKNKIRSTDDVAFIFKQLEDSAIENAFLVFVKDGKPTILHVGMGDVFQSIVDSSVVLPAYKDFGADKVYMVHNHPSGQLIASRADIDMLTTIQKQLPDTSVEGIIINTYSGNYAVISEDEVKPILETQDTVELDVLSFSKNVFRAEYKSTMAEREISGPESIAAYLSAHRLGSGSKVGALLINRAMVINGNLVTNSNEISTQNAKELAREIAEAANRCSAPMVVLFGDFDYSDKAIKELQRQIPIVSGKSVNMLDIVRLNGKHTQSLHDMTLPSRSTLSDGVRFRISDQNTLRDNLQAAITGYIVGTNTTGDVITTDDMVNTIYDYVENAGESSLKSNLVKELDAYEQNVQSGELKDSIISPEEILIENVHDIINMYSDEVMFRISNENQRVFISNAEQAVRNINMGKAPAEQWLKTIEKAGGLKAGEDKWIGLSDWLKSKGKDTLTKDEVLQFIGNNRIIIQEQHYLEEIDFDADEQEQIDAMNEEFLALRSEAEEAGEWIHDAAEIAYMQMADKYGDDFTIGFGVDSGKLYVANIEAASTITGIAPRPERLIDGTRLKYTTNGLDDNHEIALIVPTIESWNRTDDLHFGDAGDGRAIAWIRFGETTIQDPLTPEAVAADKARAEFIADKKAKYGENYLSQLTEEEKEQFKPLLRFSSAYKRAAVRKVLVIDEIQSKRHQEGREKGYKGDFALTKEKKRLSAELDKKYEQRGSLIRERENERDGEMYEIARIDQELLEVRNNRDYDRLMAERDAITQKQQTRNDEILSIRSEIRELEKELGELAMDFGFSLAVPDAPFEKNWHELAMKRMLRYAAENGYDKIAWTKGEQQAERYNIGNYVSSIERQEEYDGNIDFGFYMGDADEAMTITVDKDGIVVSAEGHLSQAEDRPLADLVGKEMAIKMMQMEEYDVLEGTDLLVGGEGMKSFYDRMLPSFMNKYGKKWGVKVEDIFLPNLESNGITMHSIDVTPEMKESVMQGQVMFRADQDPLVQNEMQSIINSAKANGTYMKAPNGKQSNLTPEQWAMVRTKNFKNWFGDWEMATRASMIMKLPAISLDEMTPLTKKQAEAVVKNLEEGKNKYDGRKTTWVISSIGKIIGHKGFDNSLLIPMLKEVYDNSIYLMSEPEIRKEGHKEHNNFVGYHHYVGKITFDGTEYYVRLTLQEVKTRKKDFIPNQLHSTFVSDIEIYSTNNRVNTGNTPATANVDAKYFDAKLEQFFENANNSSKIVDENGEPMVVYHGSVSENITAFDKEKIRINETDASYNGFWFSTDPDTSPAWRNAKMVYPVFLNLRNPIIRKDAEKIAREYLKTDAAFDSIGDNGIRGAADAVRAKIQREGYDGVIHFGKPSINIDEFNRTGQTIFSTSDGVRYIISKEEDGINVYEYSSYEPDYKGDFNTSIDTIEEFMDDSYFFGEEIYVVFEPSQIKSATDNIGTFDPANPDIRFRAVPTTTAEDIDKNGFRSYLSEKDYDRMKKEILKGAPILRMSLYTPDEYISSVIDKLTQQSPSDTTEALQMASSVRDAFTRAGIVLDMSDNEIIYALWKEVNPSDAVTIKERLEHNHKSNDVRYRIDSTIGPNTNDIKLTRGEQFRENWVDKMVTVKMFQDLVKKRGGSVEDNLNPYITENLSLGRQQRENELFQENIYRPMVEQVTAIEKLFVKEGLASKEDAYKAVNDFLYARHAPERNRHVVIGEIEDYITRAITPAEMKFISGDNPRAEIRALATRIYNIYANGVADTSEVFAKNMLNTRYKSKDLNERLKEFRNKFIDTVKGAKEYTEKVFNSKKGTNRSGMSDKEAKEIIDKYYVKRTQAELNKLSDLVRESTHFTLDTWYKYNMISAKERDNYKSMYKYYIPLRNWEVSEDIDYSELTHQAFNHASEIISTNKKARGRSSRADNPLAYIASLAQSAIVLGNKNQVRLNMYRLVLKNLNILGDIATIPKVYFVKNNATGEITQTTERPAQELFDQGLVETKTNKDYRWHKTGAEYQAHLIPVIINGDRHLIEMRGEFGVKIASAINNTNSVHLSYLDATRPVTQWLSATRTSYNPEFIPTNFVRDFMFGNMAYAVEGGNILKLNQNLGRAFRAINRSELDTKYKDQYDRYYEEFMNEGAQTGFMNMRNIETMKKDLEKMHKQMLRAGGKASDMKNFAIKYGSAGIQYLNAMSENAMRFAVYLTEREKGTSAKQAAFAAKEITVNFNRKGRYTENMGALYSFFNASVQGTARLYDLTKKHGRRTAVALATLTAIKLASDLICVLAAGDDYDELSDYVKFSNILIPIGEQEDGRMKFLKIPMAQGVRAVTNIADVTVDVIRGTKTVGEATKTFFLNNLGEHLPLSFEAIDLTGRDNMASFVTPFLPSVAVPFFEAWRNTDFKGDPIYRDDFTLASKEYQPRYTIAYGSTNPAYVALSRGLNALAGGNDELTSAIKVDENGNISRRWYGYAFDINPAIVEHIIDGFMGGITTFPSNTIKTISSAISDEKEVELYNVPILNRFVSVPTYKEGYDLYYRTGDLVRDIQASEKAVKAVGDMDAYRAIRNNRFNATIKNAYLEYNDRVKYLKELMGNPDLSTQQMKDIETRMDEVMKDASAAFEEIYNKYDNNIERYEED